MKILGISAYYHDSAAVLIENGNIIAAAQEERFTRVKHDKNYPEKAIDFCLEYTGTKPSDIELVCFYEKPLTKFHRIIETHIAFSPFSFNVFRKAMSSWLFDKIFFKKKLIRKLKKIDSNIDWSNKIIFSEHHLSHAASAFFPSPFESSAILTMDGVGEWTTSSLAIGSNNNIKILDEIHFPHSLGMLYSAFTSYTGFRVNSGEYKVMGLAPYGNPIYKDLIKDNLLDIKDDGTFRLNLNYFDYHLDSRMTNKNFHKLFGGPPREPEAALTQKEMDIASSIQCVTEEIIIKLARSIKAKTNMDNLCLAGGVALNCVANGKLQNENIFKNIWIQPAAGDAGGALGAAMAGYYLYKGIGRNINSLKGEDAMQGSFLGPDYSDQDIQNRLSALGANYQILEYEKIYDFCADSLSKGKAIGWHQGRMEFGPRALGARSILGDPRSKSMQKVLNLKVKYRESFRPFAPSILFEDASNWFDIKDKSPYMLFVQNVKEEHRIRNEHSNQELFGIDKLNQPRSSIPAITHIDYSARIQTVHENTNPKYHALISRFKELTDFPLLVNTSFNVRGEPIVNSPEDAFKCFMGTGIEVLVIGKCVLLKDDQDKSLAQSYLNEFKLD